MRDAVAIGCFQKPGRTVRAVSLSVAPEHHRRRIISVTVKPVVSTEDEVKKAIIVKVAELTVSIDGWDSPELSKEFIKFKDLAHICIFQNAVSFIDQQYRFIEIADAQE